MINNKKSNKEFTKEVYDLVGDEYTFLEKYINSNTKLKVIHNKCGYEYEVTPNHFLQRKRCPNCFSAKRQSNKEFLKEVYDLVGDEYTFLEKYVNTNTRLKIIHNKCGNEYEVEPRNFKKGNRCPFCNNLQKKKSHSEYEKEFNKISDGKYKLLSKYESVRLPVIVKHLECGYEYSVNAGRFIRGDKCPQCSFSKKRKTTNSFKVNIKEFTGTEYTLLTPYINNKTKVKLKHNKCGNEYWVAPNYFMVGRRCPYCCLKSSSRSEKSVLKFITKIYNGIIIENDRKILDGKEIDIYLPDLKIGIEYCGMYWHSELYKDKNYHLDKLNKCHEKGIRLIQIFEDEWNSKKKILKSKIKHILGLNYSKEKIYARKCTIKEIHSISKNEFLDKYHIQGKDLSKIKLGLFFNEILVACMTFSRPRVCLGGKQNSNNNSYELSRFATKRKYNVVGGFSKLLSYFKKNYEFDNITTYADLRYSSFEGNLYEVNGFRLSHQSKPNYWYFYKHNQSVKYHRFNFRKGNLKKLFPEIYKEKLTEHEIMLKAKYLRIYDCGTLVYKLEKP